MTENGVRRVVTGDSGQRSAVAGDHLVEPVVVSACPATPGTGSGARTSRPPAGQDSPGPRPGT